MKKIIIFLLALILLTGCGTAAESTQIAATTLPVYEFTARLCAETDLQVCRLITESVSCLHDYSLNVSQVRKVEAAELIVISGAGLEDFMEDVLHNKDVIDSSFGIEIEACETLHDHDHHQDHGHDHSHEMDSHIWLSPENALIMADNICRELSLRFPAYTAVFEENLGSLRRDIEDVQSYADAALASLSCRDIITFHDGFGYLAESFDLHILEAVEEESGSEASARDLIHLIETVREHQLPAIFTEMNGSVSAASIISRETGAEVYTLDMAMSGDSWFDAMYHNIDTLKEALE